MDREEVFIEDVVAHPEDHSLRQILADYLEEQDDPRGTLLRYLQSLMHRPLRAGARPEVSARVREEDRPGSQRRWYRTDRDYWPPLPLVLPAGTIFDQQRRPAHPWAPFRRLGRLIAILGVFRAGRYFNRPWPSLLARWELASCEIGKKSWWPYHVQGESLGWTNSYVWSSYRGKTFGCYRQPLERIVANAPSFAALHRTPTDRLTELREKLTLQSLVYSDFLDLLDWCTEPRLWETALACTRRRMKIAGKLEPDYHAKAQERHLARRRTLHGY